MASGSHHLRHQEFSAAIPGTTFFRVVGGDGPFLAKACGGDSLRVNTALDEQVPHHVGSIDRQRFVRVGVARAVRVSIEFNGHVRVAHHDFDEVGHGRVRVRSQLGCCRFEVEVVEHEPLGHVRTRSSQQEVCEIEGKPPCSTARTVPQGRRMLARVGP